MSRRRIIIVITLLILIWIPLTYVNRLVGAYIMATRVTPPDDNGQGEPSGPEYITILFLGLDVEDMDQPKSSVRTDAIVIGTAHLYTKEVRLLSIPRDTYVEIPGRGMDKINHAFSYGGGTRRHTAVNLTKETIINFLGIEGIDHYVMVDMQSVPRLVDALGGVEIDVDINDPRLPPRGRHLLTGEQALAYARWRWDPMGDINRVKRQQKLLLALADQVNRLKPGPAMVDLIRYTLSEVHTDVSFVDALFYAVRFQDVRPESIEFHSVPGWFLNLRGVSYWDPNLEALQPIIQHVFYLEEEAPVEEVDDR